MIDEAGSRLRLAEAEREPAVSVAHIEDVVARIARIPPKTVSSSDRDVLRNLERNLKLVIYGQDRAIETLSAAIKMSRSGLGDQRKPVGLFLFAGPTGVGKTEVTRQLALECGAGALRHVRVHGAAHGVATDRRASGLRWLRPGRAAHRGDHQAPIACCCSTRSRRRTPTSSICFCR